VNDVTIDIKQRRTIVALFDQMRIPELVVERFAGHQTVSSSACFYALGHRHHGDDSKTPWLVGEMLWNMLK
jgi:hypothetical protein